MSEFDVDGSVPIPAWVMWGVEQPDGSVVVMASRDVSTGGALEPEYEPRADTRYAMNVVMTRVTLVAGEDWRDAFARLFATWSPGPDRVQIGARPQLEGS